MTAAKLAEAIVSALERAGATIRVHGDTLHIGPASAVAPDLHSTIQRHKPAIVALLRQRAVESPESAVEDVDRGVEQVEDVAADQDADRDHHRHDDRDDGQDAEVDADDHCPCGGEVWAFTPSGAPRCVEHVPEEIRERVPV